MSRKGSQRAQGHQRRDGPAAAGGRGIRQRQESPGHQGQHASSKRHLARKRAGNTRGVGQQVL